MLLYVVDIDVVMILDIVDCQILSLLFYCIFVLLRSLYPCWSVCLFVDYKSLSLYSCQILRLLMSGLVVGIVPLFLSLSLY